MGEFEAVGLDQRAVAEDPDGVSIGDDLSAGENDDAAAEVEDEFEVVAGDELCVLE